MDIIHYIILSFKLFYIIKTFHNKILKKIFDLYNAIIILLFYTVVNSDPFLNMTPLFP